MNIEKDIIGMIKEKDTFAKYLGIEILEAKNGTSHVSMPLGEKTANSVGVVHGGAVFALADMAFAAASNSEGVLSLGIEASIQYLAPCDSSTGTLEAKGVKTGETKRLGFYRVEIFKPGGEIISLFQGIVYKKL